MNHDKGKRMLVNKFHEDQLLFLKYIIQYFDESIAVLEVSQEGIQYCFNNVAHQKLSGYAAEEIQGKRLEQVLGAKYYQVYERKISDCSYTNKNASFTETAAWKGNEKELVCRLIPFQSHGKSYVVAIEMDVYFLKTWLKENNLSVTRFDLMFQANSSIMLLIEPETGDIIDANPAAVEFYGYSLEELTHMKIQQINTLSDNEVKKYRESAARDRKQYFFFRHRIKSGELRFVDVYSSPIEIDQKQYLFSVILDATQREENEEELFREKELQRITMDSIADAVVTTDLLGNINYMNKAAENAVGCKAENAIGKAFADVIPMYNEITMKKIPCIVQTVLETGQTQEVANHTIIYSGDNKSIPIEDSAAPIKDKNGDIYGAVVIFRDISHAIEKKKKIEYMSYHDVLTGLYNRRFYYDNIDKMDSELNYPIGYIMGDVNGLKMTNDVFGHNAGDQLLVTVANVLSQSVSSEQIVARWGGDEFVIVLQNASLKQMEFMIDDIKKNLKKQMIMANLEVSVSFGMALKEKVWESTDAVIKEAEEMMYRNKLFESKSLRANTIQALMTTLDEKSQETKEHTMRLSNFCLEIADQLYLQPEEKNRLELLAMIHDIGKVGIPDNILGKKGVLNEEEWSIMKTHPEIGYRIASNVTELSFVANEILHHHERWDGTGYPSQLKGENIPVNCRILSVVDAYDAMTNDRVYRKARPHEEAVAELIKCSGSQFDSQIVSLLVNNLQNRKQ